MSRGLGDVYKRQEYSVEEGFYMVMMALQAKWGIYALKLMAGYVIVETKVVWRLMHQQVE